MCCTCTMDMGCLWSCWLSCHNSLLHTLQNMPTVYMWSEWTAILPCKGYMYNTLSLLVHDCIDEQQEAMLFCPQKVDQLAMFVSKPQTLLVMRVHACISHFNSASVRSTCMFPLFQLSYFYMSLLSFLSVSDSSSFSSYSFLFSLPPSFHLCLFLCTSLPLFGSFL